MVSTDYKTAYADYVKAATALVVAEEAEYDAFCRLVAAKDTQPLELSAGELLAEHTGNPAFMEG